MTTPIADQDKERAIVAVVNWRAADKAHIADKSDCQKQRAEYRERQYLRFAADKLVGGDHG